MKHAIYVIVNGQLKLLSAYNNKEIAESLYKKYRRNGTFEVILALYNGNIPVVTTADLYTLGIKQIAGDLEQEIKELKKRCKDLRAESDSKDTAVFNANAKYNELKKEIEELKWNHEGLQLENYQKKTDLFVVNTKYNDLKEKYNALETENASLKNEIMDLKNKKMDLNQYLSIEKFEKLETKNKKKFWQL